MNITSMPGKSSKTHPIISAMNSLLSSVEKSIFQESGKAIHPPIFIVGAPRSGTTLLHQIIVSAFDVGYIDNISSRFWGAPAIGVSLSNEILPFKNRVISDFSSEFGFTSDVIGPHEFGYFWNRWFKYEATHKLTDRELDEVDRQGLIDEIGAMVNLIDRPMIFKNPVAITLQAKFLAMLFPDSIFIFCRREAIFNAKSLLENRSKFSGDISEWFSTKPKEYVDLKSKGLAEQVIGQVFYCEKAIEEATDTLRGRENPMFVNIDYEALCNNPEQAVEEIEDTLLVNNVRIYRKKTEFSAFKNANSKDSKHIPFRELEDAFKRFYER